jgi:hypothetical protein
MLQQRKTMPILNPDIPDGPARMLGLAQWAHKTIE